jgi:hypothetical protein
MRRRLGTETRPSVALTVKHILFNHQLWAQQVTGNPDTVTAWQYASANCADFFDWCGWNRAEDFFNFKLMSLFACQNTGNNFPYPQKWVLFLCASRRK